MKKCRKCGAKMFADTSRTYFTNPPQYLFRCLNCTNVEFGNCLEDDTVEEMEDNETINENCTNWHTMRNWTAMFAMNGLIASGIYKKEDVTKMSVEYANALIRELKKSNKIC